MTSPTTKQPRPKYLDLFSIRLPVPGWVSILHRISGAGLFLLLPFLLWLLDNSLHSMTSFRKLEAVVDHAAVKVILTGLAWAYLHHLLAGLRHLALDADLGTELSASRASSKIVLVGSLALTAVVAVAIW